MEQKLLIILDVIIFMAVGFSGSNGGVQEAYRNFDLADVSAGIAEYETLYKKEHRSFYQKAVDGLKELKGRMTEGSEELEGRL